METIVVRIERKHTPTERNPLASLIEVREVIITREASTGQAMAVAKMFQELALSQMKIFQMKIFLRSKSWVKPKSQ